MVRTDRYKYIVYLQGEHPEQFFDLKQDPGELKNLIGDRALAPEVARHRSLLAQWRQETDDVPGKGGDFAKRKNTPRKDRAAQATL